MHIGSIKRCRRVRTIFWMDESLRVEDNLVSGDIQTPELHFNMALFSLLALCAVASADMYLQNIRGSNNRLDEANRDRNNANRYVRFVL